MPLPRFSGNDLLPLLVPHLKKSAFPGLEDAARKRAAMNKAKSLGEWERIGKLLSDGKPVPRVLRSDYRDYRRTGTRERGQAAYQKMMDRTEAAAAALWLKHPCADPDYLQDLLWAWCETTSWVWPAHENCHVDLASSKVGAFLGEIVWLLRKQLEEEVRARVETAVLERVVYPALDPRTVDWWRTAKMNWNHVCNANAISAALDLVRDPHLLAQILQPLIERLQFAIDGFGDDGSCLEGPGYWGYGFGHFVTAAILLRHRTGGGVDLMADEKVARICRYPLAAHIAGRHRACFGDAGEGYLQADAVFAVNRFHRLPGLFAQLERDRQGRYLRRRSHAALWRWLLLYDPPRKVPPPSPGDALLPDVGLVKFNAGKGRRRTVLMAQAGRNDYPHNHNDVGTFLLYKHGACLLNDGGPPAYTSKTFGPQRYEILFCNSFGHSVPVVNGKGQPAGSEYYGTLEVDNLGGDGVKRAWMELAHAYDDKSLKSRARALAFHPDGTLELTDTYEFTRKPRAVEEGFMTFAPARLIKNGGGVRIGTGKATLTLRAVETPGRFVVKRLEKESAEGATGRVATRIAFMPRTLAKKMTLAFRMA